MTIFDKQANFENTYNIINSLSLCLPGWRKGVFQHLEGAQHTSSLCKCHKFIDTHGDAELYYIKTTLSVFSIYNTVNFYYNFDHSSFKKIVQILKG